jgi:hypothetical protein
MSTSRLGTSKVPSGPNDLSKFREEVCVCDRERDGGRRRERKRGREFITNGKVPRRLLMMRIVN